MGEPSVGENAGDEFNTEVAVDMLGAAATAASACKGVRDCAVCCCVEVVLAVKVWVRARTTPDLARTPLKWLDAADGSAESWPSSTPTDD